MQLIYVRKVSRTEFHLDFTKNLLTKTKKKMKFDYIGKLSFDILFKSKINLLNQFLNNYYMISFPNFINMYSRLWNKHSAMLIKS